MLNKANVDMVCLQSFDIPLKRQLHNANDLGIGPVCIIMRFWFDSVGENWVK